MNLTLRDVIALLRQGVEESGSMRAYARKIGADPGNLNHVLRGEMLPGPSILSPLGLKRVKVPPPPPEYKRING